ncbi:amidinotransferase [Candidatus Saccharibacteria bacterium]|nr:amidinotransferase [Candidatus Saccharibacteria bacterium]
MHNPLINRTVLMSGAQYFDDTSAINPYMDDTIAVDRVKAQVEHDSIRHALEAAGVHVEQVAPPQDCQDGVYTANWALIRGNKAVMASLPNVRQAETPYAEKVLKNLGKEIIYPPEGMRFSGQGDALPCGDLLFCGSQYRTDLEIYDFLHETLGYEVIGLRTIPALDESGTPKTNASSGWPDSFFYDIDLALAVLTPSLIAWCPEAFTDESQDKIHALNIDKIEVSFEEATQGFACNLVSTGFTVVMSAHAPLLQAQIEAHGLKTITPEVSELGKGGGYIRCTTLTLDN